jgi:hypothetical protein
MIAYTFGQELKPSLQIASLVARVSTAIFDGVRKTAESQGLNKLLVLELKVIGRDLTRTKENGDQCLASCFFRFKSLRNGDGCSRTASAKPSFVWMV